jgi:hypothetical protein
MTSTGMEIGRIEKQKENGTEEELMKSLKTEMEKTQTKCEPHQEFKKGTERTRRKETQMSCCEIQNGMEY